METKQIIKGGAVTYITEDGWEDPTLIEIDINPIVRKTRAKTKNRRYFLVKNPFFRLLLNNGYIEPEFFFKSRRETKLILLQNASKRLQQDLINKYGSLYKAELSFLKRRGFKSSNEYHIYRAQLRGFKSRHDLFNFWARKQGFKNLYEQKLHNLRKKGFNSQRAYRQSLLDKNGLGLRTFYQLGKYNKFKKARKLDEYMVINGTLKKKAKREGQARKAVKKDETSNSRINNKKLKRTDNLTIEDTTHTLRCRHACRFGGYDYNMDCIILEQIPNNKLRILVFGDRNWKKDKDKKRIRCVDANRVTQKVKIKLDKE